MIDPQVLLRQYQWRYAVREFDPDKKLSPNELNNILQSMVLTPSSFGSQPWQIVVVQDDTMRQTLLPFCYHQRQIVDSSHVLVLCGRKDYSLIDVKEQHHKMLLNPDWDVKVIDRLQKTLTSFCQTNSAQQIQGWVRNQVYILMGFALASCAAMGIDACPMEGFSSDDVDRELGLNRYTSVLMLPLGYRKVDSPASKFRFELDRVVQFHGG